MNIRALFPLTIPWQKISCEDNIVLFVSKGKTSIITLLEITKISSKEYTSLWFHRFDVELTMNTGEVFWFFNLSPKGFDLLKRNVRALNSNVNIEEPRIFSFTPIFAGFRIGLQTFKDSATRKFSFENNPWATLVVLVIFAAVLIYVVPN